MSEQEIQIGDHKIHLGIDYCFFGDEELDCPICGKELYRQEPYSGCYQLPTRASCPHVIFYWERTRNGGHFFFIRPDFAKPFIQALLKSEYYKEFLQNPHRNNPQSNRSSMHHPRPLKNSEIALFVSGVFSSDDPMFVGSKALVELSRVKEKIGFYRDPFSVDLKGHFDFTWFQESIRSEEIGARVGNISHAIPSIEHPECLPDNAVVYYNYEGVSTDEKHDGRTRTIAISPTEYHNPGVRGLSEL